MRAATAPPRHTVTSAPGDTRQLISAPCETQPSSEGVAESLADGDNYDLAPGVVELWQ